MADKTNICMPCCNWLLLIIWSYISTATQTTLTWWEGSCLEKPEDNRRRPSSGSLTPSSTESVMRRIRTICTPWYSRGWPMETTSSKHWTMPMTRVNGGMQRLRTTQNITMFFRRPSTHSVAGKTIQRNVPPISVPWTLVQRRTPTLGGWRWRRGSWGVCISCAGSALLRRPTAGHVTGLGRSDV